MENNPTSQTSASTKGVLYDQSDYAGFWRRLVATIVDLSLLLLMGCPLTIFWAVITPDNDSIPPTFFITYLALAYLYLALLKPTKVRTLGFIIADLKIVNLEGERPSLWTMTLRFFLLGFVLLGPLYFLLDLLWLINDPNGQTFLDKVSSTYVVKRQAAPVATGVQKTVIYHILGFTLLFREVGLGGQSTVALKPLEEESDKTEMS